MSESNDTPQQPYSRNGRRFADRLALTTVVSAGAGALIGGYIGGKHAGRQYLAERAHRLPKTVQGWFFYQKWKNYRSIVGSLKSASKYGLQIGACAFAFVALEEMLDRAAGKVQMGSTVAASLATAIAKIQRQKSLHVWSRGRRGNGRGTGLY
ncbi:hypothetical protein EV183_002187 [Coemansia sp. RSA 2336]|nr:hypothetical protein EV183_002187 [Coemansia sp. RSA 2336]